MCLKTYELDPARFLSVLGLVQQAVLMKNKIKLDRSNDVDLLLVVEKGIGRGIYHTIYQYIKGNNKYMKEYLS